MAGKHNFNRPTIRPTFVGSSTRAGGTTSDTPSLHIRRRHTRVGGARGSPGPRAY